MNADELPLPEDIETEARTTRAFRKGCILGCVIALVIPLAFTGCGLLALGVLMELGYIPASDAVPGDEITASTLEFLRREELLDEDERVLFFYSDAMFSVREDGNFFTERRVVSYWEPGDELQVEWAGYHEIDGLSFWPEEGFFSKSTIEIERLDGSTFNLIVSNEGDRDSEFNELLELTWREQRNGDPARRGRELSHEVLEHLRGEGIIAEDEQVHFFYAKTSGSLRVDGNLFTDSRVISYWEEDGEIITDEAVYAQIVRIRRDWQAGPHGVTLVSIVRIDGDPIELWVSAEDGGDREFVQRLVATWKARR